MKEDDNTAEDDNDSESKYDIPLIQRISSILWPSFITAGIANSFFFTFFEPQALLYAAGYSEMSNIAVYSIGFFMFWLLTSSSCVMTSYFMKPCCDVNS
ncbi:MAG: hypothetical protein OQL16_13910 [Gammaproteobacteria bacterium]|nr:hypothetical protein [Gammaproteobacteria bacterium]